LLYFADSDTHEQIKDDDGHDADEGHIEEVVDGRVDTHAVCLKIAHHHGDAAEEGGARG